MRRLRRRLPRNADGWRLCRFRGTGGHVRYWEYAGTTQNVTPELSTPQRRFAILPVDGGRYSESERRPDWEQQDGPGSRIKPVRGAAADQQDGPDGGSGCAPPAEKGVTKSAVADTRIRSSTSPSPMSTPSGRLPPGRFFLSPMACRPRRPAGRAEGRDCDDSGGENSGGRDCCPHARRRTRRRGNGSGQRRAG